MSRRTFVNSAKATASLTEHVQEWSIKGYARQTLSRMGHGSQRSGQLRRVGGLPGAMRGAALTRSMTSLSVAVASPMTVSAAP